jgi:hypothetical protein
MRKINIRIAALALIVLVFLSCPICLRAQVEKAAPYPAMALLDQYLIPDENAEIALARSAAPASISDAAEVMVLRRDGYATAVKGANVVPALSSDHGRTRAMRRTSGIPKCAPPLATIRQPQALFCLSFL